MKMMKYITMLIVALSAISAAHVHMEKAVERFDYDMVGRVSPNEYHTVVFAVKQKNLDVVEKLLLEKSSPKSDSYRNWMTYHEIRNMTQNEIATEALEFYLRDQEIHVTRVNEYGEYLEATAKISTWEKLFANTFYFYKSNIDSSLPSIIRANHYALPYEISEHVSAVMKVVDFPPQWTGRTKLTKKSDVNIGTDTVTPSLLNSYYNIDSNTGSSLASQSCFESLGQFWSQDDLTTFQKQFDLPQEEVAEDIGSSESDSECEADANNCAEANLDIQYMMAIAQGIPTTMWYDDATDAFTDWIMAVASTENPPLVHSMSYGSIETAMSSSVANVFNTEAMKLGLSGVTIFVSSGDDGVANFQARYLALRCGYTPSFPASCPYVTAVGATQGPESGTEEIACQSNEGGVITTGGGFSTIFDAASWQTDAIADYFATATAPVSGYNENGRGYPDVAMTGYNYEVVIAGETYLLSGTSASSPVVAGMASLVNSKLLEAGESSIGFINPTIYENGNAFNDVTSGENQCTAGRVCCDEGFYAAKSWDPLTGFGSVDYAKFEAIFD